METLMLSAWDFIFSNPLALFFLIIGLVFFLAIVLAPPPWQLRKRTAIGSEEPFDPLPGDPSHEGRKG
jgi:hypothetical protein